MRFSGVRLDFLRRFLFKRLHLQSAKQQRELGGVCVNAF
jgi:hypothetical protein